MKKTFKRILCLVLTITLALAAVIPAFASNRQTPVIVIPGVVNTPVYDDAGNRLFGPDFENNLDIEKAIQALKHVLKLQESRQYDRAMNELLDILHDLFDPSMCDANGKSVRKAHCIKTSGPLAEDDTLLQYTGEGMLAKTIADQIGWKNTYIFSYDWRLDIIHMVDTELAPYIEQVKKETGSDQVKIIGCSMGGAVTNTYLTRYGDRNDVKKVIFFSSASQGVQFVNDIFSSETVNVNRPAVAPYFKAVLGDAPAIGFAALSRYVSQIANSLMDSQYQKLWEDFAVKDLLSFPAFWELADHTPEVERLLQKYKSANFQNMIMEYYKVQDSIQDTQKALIEKGVDICYTSNYNLTGVPVTENATTLNTDYLIDTFHTSHGATVAELGKTLGDNYTQKQDKEHNHLSEDGVIDASTCFLPETTWFIKDMVHVDLPYNSAQSKFITWLITNDNVDVTSNPDYPQFMRYSKKDDTLTPVAKVVIETPENAGGEYVSSAVTVYTYTQITALGWAVIAACAAVIIILIAKKKKRVPIEGVLTKEEIKALPKSERKAAKKQNKARIKEWKKEQKANAKARKAELKAMPKAQRKAAIKADKAQAKANAKQMKAEAKAAKAQRKLAKKAAKAAKKAK